MIIQNEIAPYLPHGLEVITTNTFKGKMIGIRNNKIIVDFRGYKNIFIDFSEVEWVSPLLEDEYDVLEIKPILLPLYDLTKEIEVNGEKIIPSAKMCSHGFHNEFWNDPKPKFMEYQDVQKLFEWHFDVFGLIARGDAIDINTLKL